MYVRSKIIMKQFLLIIITATIVIVAIFSMAYVIGKPFEIESCKNLTAWTNLEHRWNGIFERNIGQLPCEVKLNNGEWVSIYDYQRYYRIKLAHESK